MRVAVCDCEKRFRDELKKSLYGYSGLLRLELVIEEFSCGEDLIDSKHIFEFIFLDYNMEGINGLETARVLRKKGINSAIVFLTGYPEFVYDAFEVFPFRFLKKPLDEGRLYKALDDYFESLEGNSPILLKVDRDTVCVQTRDILYLEADNKKCYVNLFGKRLHIAKTMVSVENLLSKSTFCKVHKSFIVNLVNVNSYNKESISLSNGAYVPVSRSYASSFKEALRHYIESQNG